tara:strand:- start:3488 stop:3613 length:126 start_codon:yes stop_codon:yes gene_type:complete
MLDTTFEYIAWIAAAKPTRMLYLGDLHDDLRERHAVLYQLN